MAAGPEMWVPLKWQGGPLELKRRSQNKTLPADSALRETIGQWYDSETLDLLKGTPINCLLVTWSTGSDPELEQQQHKLVKAYAQEARKRGIAVLGQVFPGSAISSFVEPALDAGLEGLVLEGDFPGGERFVSEVQQALRNKNSAAVVVPVTAWESLKPSLDTPILATAEAVAPNLREFVEGVEATPSSEPWIDSNIWLVRSIRPWDRSRPIWLE